MAGALLTCPSSFLGFECTNAKRILIENFSCQNIEAFVGYVPHLYTPLFTLSPQNGYNKFNPFG